MKSPLFRSRSGAALVITLLFLVIIALLVVGFSETSRVERVSARNHFEQQRANELAQRGLDQVTATLLRETVDPPDPALTPTQIAGRSRNWISQPGQLIVPAASALDSGAAVSARKQLSRSVRLHSGTPGSAAPSDPILTPPDLNIQTLVDQTPPTYLITDRLDASNRPQPMRVRWVYLRQDGSWDTDPSDPTLPNENPDLTNTTNPIVGRYAFWADDDSSKINYNLAWKRNAASPAHPSQINLTALTLPGGSLPVSTAMADAIHNFTAATTGRFFNSFADARQIGASPSAPAGVAAMLNYNKFELTHFNHDPDTTFFGEDRILLNTDPALVPKAPDGKFARKFLDIRTTPTADPGVAKNIDKAKFNDVLQTLVPYLQREDWPILPPGSTASLGRKFYGAGATIGQIAQVAANILGYVIAKESKEPVVPALRFSYVQDELNQDKGTFVLDGWQNPSYQALTRQPLVTEMAIWQASTPDVPAGRPADWPGGASPWALYKTTQYLELYLPPNYGFSPTYSSPANQALDLSYRPNELSWFLYLAYLPNNGNWFTRDSAGAWQRVKDPGTPSAIPCVPVFNSDISKKGGVGPATLLEPGSRVVIKKEFYAPSSMAGGLVQWRCGLTRQLATTGGVEPFQTRDIMVPQVLAVPYKLGPKGTPPEKIPSLETDDPRVAFSPMDWKYNAAGNTLGDPNSISSVGQAPKSGIAEQDTDASGKISDASLYMPPPNGVGSNGPAGDNGRISSLGELGYVHTGIEGAKEGVPWRTLRFQPNAFAKADTVPDWALLDLFGVPNTGILGANAVTTPNGSSVGGRINVNSRVEPFALQRDRGLLALLTGTSISNPATVAANIYNHRLAGSTGSGAFGKAYGYLSAYDNPWEICEIAGVTDGGEISEKVMREIGSLITARGDVFSIYSVGQALLQTPAGKLVVTGEQRQHSVVERVLDTRGTNDPRDDRVSLRTVYRRNLNP